ncbi:helix-turn-helix transcriptional regulator [Geminicoccaceae bacterium 1502E]|nr:helix-turn-helix transcriptional regulator [Geminicoccaceae bacterium 1502E]
MPASPETDRCLDSARISALARDELAFSRGPHSHASAQLIYAISGVVGVTTSRGTWIVPPNRAVWVPAEVEHATRSYGPVQFRAVFVPCGTDCALPRECCVVAVSPLLRELVLRLVALEGAGKRGPFAQRVSQLLVEELSFHGIQPLSLPMPQDARLAALCAELRSDPARRTTLEQAAASLGMSRRTFMRTFLRETGLSFGRWLQQARLMEALPLLARGRSVLSVALDCGYQSPSAFAATFRRSLGTSPRDYFSGKRDQ